MSAQNKLGPPKKCWYCTHLGGCLKENGPCEKFEKHVYHQAVIYSGQYDRINTLRFEDVALLIHTKRKYITSLIKKGKINEILHSLKLATGADYIYNPGKDKIRFERVECIPADVVADMIRLGALDKLYNAPKTSLTITDVCKILDIPYPTAVNHIKNGKQCYINRVITKLFEKTGKHYILDTEISRKKFILKGD